MTDLEIKDAIVKGQLAARLLADRFRVRLEGFLVGKCSANDEASRNCAVVVASEIIEDCFVKSPSLLERWNGGETLWPFLSRVGLNRLRDYWSKRDLLKEADRPGASGGEDERTIDDVVSAAPVETDGLEEANAARHCLAAGMQAALEQAPEGMLFLRLKGLHGAEQRRISEVWGHDQSQTSRRIHQAMELIRVGAEEFARNNCLEIGFRDMERHAGMLLGGDGSAAAVTADVQAALRELASGGARQQRDALISQMLANPAALRFFAELLNQRSPDDAVLVVDSAVRDGGPRLRAALSRCGESLPPAEARGLLDPLSLRLFEIHLHRAGADGGTLWLLATDRSALEAIANPLEPSIIGLRQPLKSGNISFVLGSEKPIIVDSASAHERYSPAVDQKTGQTTKGMVAVPFAWCGAVRGVLSMVRFGGDSFGEADLSIAEDAAALLGSRMETALQRKLLGWT